MNPRLRNVVHQAVAAGEPGVDRPHMRVLALVRAYRNEPMAAWRVNVTHARIPQP